MAFISKAESSSSQFSLTSASSFIDDDDFQDPCPSQFLSNNMASKPVSRKPQIPSSSAHRDRKKAKKQRYESYDGEIFVKRVEGQNSDELVQESVDLNCGLDSIDCSYGESLNTKEECTSKCSNEVVPNKKVGVDIDESSDKKNNLFSCLVKRQAPEFKKGYFTKSIESRLLKSAVGLKDGGVDEELGESSELDVLLKLCREGSEGDDNSVEDEEEEEQNCTSERNDYSGLIYCPLCGRDITDLREEQRQVHTNECIDKEDAPSQAVGSHRDTSYQYLGQVLDASPTQTPQKIVAMSPVVEWLRKLGLVKYGELFIQHEIDWDTLKLLTEEDLFKIGVSALGPRKKIVHALSELRKENIKEGVHIDAKKAVVVDDTNNVKPSKLITDYFPSSVVRMQNDHAASTWKKLGSDLIDSSHRTVKKIDPSRKAKYKDTPIWCSIPGTSFRVDAFKYLRRDCSHWFLTHFHADHYQGLTKSFCHGKIYCSLVTAKLVNMKIGIPMDTIEVLPLNKRINIAGTGVTCFDANHCPGAIIILFEPSNGKAVLHTGDFRVCDEMMNIPVFQSCKIHTLILDTTYCDPQYDFPNQNAVIQFVIEAIQAEAFNPKTLFLIGSYTIGKERLYVEIARALRKKVYVTAAKLRILQCLGFSDEDMQFFTLNEQESHIHVVPLWSLANFKRLKHIANQYMGRFSLIVSFSPTGWSFGKGKQKNPGKRWQQGTMIRYEVPYSEHSSFSELRKFVKFVAPSNIIPSVNNHGLESTRKMVSLLSGSLNNAAAATSCGSCLASSSL
ncbi:unnamed protein product [Cuscuta epithymum]|uniref:SAM domain-containing protein n=1 Tax=Cuscuta epithymum TaxID=186058 RepID=A0AAV0GE67_9ASTE|nr:unnamed protein product [Cuscuta epithymum]